MKKLCLLGVVGGLGMLVACTGGTGGGPADGGSSASSSSSSSSSGDPATCTEFTVGQPVGNAIEGSAESRVIVNAISELAKSAADERDALTVQCKQIATSLDASSADQSAADAKTEPREKQKAWCALAVAGITSQKAKAGGGLQVKFMPPQCRLKVADKAACQAECAAAAVCDVKANPMKCTGGALFVACAGDCTAEAGAQLQCEGGTCTGTCDGTCNGSPTPQPPAACTGTCDGRCSSACKAPAGGRVTCTGKCSGDYEPLDCRGGKLEGGCSVDAKCDVACDVRTIVKAACPAPVIVASASGSADAAAAAKLKSVFETQLPKVVSIEERAMLEANTAGTFAANVSSVTDIKAACIPVVVKAAAQAFEDIVATAQSSATVLGSIE